MVLDFSQGKIVANAHELMIRINGANRISFQAATDAIELIGFANVITGFGGGISWSLQLDNREQLEQIAQELGLEIKGLTS